MKRREFIKTGAAGATVAGAAGLGAVGVASCSNLFSDFLPREGMPPLPDMDPYLAQVDQGLEAIASWKLSDDFEENGDGVGGGEEELLRKSLRSLYMTGMFGDLPEEGQVHPGMQERVRQALPEMDEAVFGMRDYLAGITPEEASEAQDYLKDKSNPGMEMAEWLDRQGKAVGVSTQRRMQTRSMMTQVVSRLRNQPPKSIFDEYIGHVDKLATQVGSDSEMQRQMIARMGKEEFFEKQQRLALLVQRWEDQGVVAQGAPSPRNPDADTPDVGAPDVGAQSVQDAGALSAKDGNKVTMTREETNAPTEKTKGKAVESTAAEGPSEQEKLREMRKAGAWCLGIGGGLAGLSGILLVVGVTVNLMVALAAGAVGSAAGVLLLCGLIVFIIRGVRKRRLEEATSA
ncbi:MAG: hypothetical protein GY847_08265 [Proteobacteria bacterium]|nr:hypothetical protein [Pseudomonadota bacterium]